MVLSQIEENIYELSFDEQLWLIERLAQHIRTSMVVKKNIEIQLMEMVNDPEIQNEMQMIEEEFAVTEADGLGAVTELWRNGMDTAVTVQEIRIKHIDITEDTITAQLMDGRTISVPLAWSWRLTEATPKQRANWEIIGDGHGVHWPDIDEDISGEGMLFGVPAPRPKAPSKSSLKSEKKKTMSNNPLEWSGKSNRLSQRLASAHSAYR